ncbi:penicillin acylase family protein [Kroppenstedtia pulmonis]|uniref:Penicillin acylase family protein n=1 Tax=Kroppenstedtia pulmonis TaxID=1380685 RepID=A0A7D3Y1A4_9BACL|nr:penicillin acylase family protein [Kroppenstedtia pulmonis]QKG84143.1 penicillin acylase family protein [Kroppenstedtia pulmonis]
MRNHIRHLCLTVKIIRLWLKKRKVKRDSTQTLFFPGMLYPVKVHWDERGIPHITARTNHDAYWVQGYITAQDRLWQMDVSRRMVSGRLAEIMGSGVVGMDKLFRTLSLRITAEKSWALYSTEVQTWIKSYCQGVNTYLEETRSTKEWPIEFLLLDYEPEKWTPEDTLSIGRLLSYQLSHNMMNELFYYNVHKELGEEALLSLWEIYKKNRQPLTIEHELIAKLVNNFKRKMIRVKEIDHKIVSL